MKQILQVEKMRKKMKQIYKCRNEKYDWYMSTLWYHKQMFKCNILQFIWHIIYNLQKSQHYCLVYLKWNLREHFFHYKQTSIYPTFIIIYHEGLIGIKKKRIL